MINCIIAGVGGQGTVLATKILSAAACEKGLTVRSAETIGMAQRGGSVVSHIRIGENIYSPLIGKQNADIIIAFEPSEAVRAFPFLKKDGVMVVCTTEIKPTGDYVNNTDEILHFLKSNVKSLKLIDSNNIFKQCQSKKVLNIALIGAALSFGTLPFSLSDIENAIKNNLPEKLHDINLKALYIGGNYE